MNQIKDNYKKKLDVLYQNNIITSKQLDHFLRRDIEIIFLNQDFNLLSLSEIIPYLVIGASKKYINSMKVPYQATSYVAAESISHPGHYLYKLPGLQNGGVLDLTGGNRKFGDTVYAATHQIIIGYNAIILSATNLTSTFNNIWNWQFFGNYLKNTHYKIYLDLKKLYEKYPKTSNTLHYVIVARSNHTLKRLKIIDLYLRKKLKIFDPKCNLKVIFMTNQNGYEYLSKDIRESDNVKYIVTGEVFDFFRGLLEVRKKYAIKLMLNDGGRIMSNNIKEQGLLGEERITLEPPIDDYRFINERQLKQSILGIKGSGLDSCEIPNSILLNSTKIDDEYANVYLYALDESKVL